MKNPHFRIVLYVDYIDSEYVRKIGKGVTDFFANKDVELVTFSAGEVGDHDPAFNYQHLSIAAHVTQKNFDGIIFVTGTQLHHVTAEYIHSYLKSFQPLPLVSIGYPFDDIPSVMPDCTLGMSAVVTHLIKEHKCKHIALMGVAGNSEEAAERTRVFCETLKQNNMPVDESLFMYGGFTYTTAMDAITNYAKRNPKLNFDAIVALNDDMAYACIDFLHSKNVRVPEDVIVTGFDDLMRSSYIVPSLTSINQNIEKQGYVAAEMLYTILCGKKTVLYNTVPARAVFRQSCGCGGEQVEIHRGIDEKGEAVVLDAAAPNAAVAEWCEKSAQFVQAIHLYSDMQNEMSIDSFRRTIKSHLLSMDIQAAAVCFFKKPVSTDYFEYFPLPSETLLLEAFDTAAGFSLDITKDPIEFNPNDGVLPFNTLTNLNGMICIALFRSTIQYGYILFRPGRYDMIVYNMVCKMFANSLASSYSYTRVEQEKKKLKKEFTIANRISLTDEMTGLLNRRGFIALGQKTLEVAEAIPQSGMVLYGDMDGLKKINDTYGHAAGDRAIKAEAQLLREEFRNADIIGRLGGDEFALVATGMNEGHFVTIKKRLYANCAAWNKKSGEEFTLSISLGYALFTPEIKEYNIKMLLEQADQSLYEEKNRKKVALVKNADDSEKLAAIQNVIAARKIVVMKRQTPAARQIALAKRTAAVRSVVVVKKRAAVAKRTPTTQRIVVVKKRAAAKQNARAKRVVVIKKVEKKEK